MSLNVSNEKIDLSDLFPSQEPAKESSFFTKQSDAVNIDETPDEVADEAKTPEDSTKVPTDVQVKAKPASTAIPKLSDIESKEFNDVKESSNLQLIDFFKTKIESGELKPFNDFDDTKQSIDDYLKGFKGPDFDELWKANLDIKENELKAEIPKQIYESLPEEFRYAYEYAQQGGTNMKDMFRALAQVEEIKELDPVKDANKICEQYLKAKEWGTDEEIKEQIEQWEDLGIIGKKSAGFKPQLDKMQELVVKQKIQEQADIKQQQADQFQFYHDNVFEAIRDEDLNGLKIDKKTQTDLYNGLTKIDKLDSRGRRCTGLEYMLDDIMWKTPNYKKLAKVYLYLQNEEEFEKKIANKAVNLNVQDTVRTIKTDQIKKVSGSTADNTVATRKPVGIQRPSSLFKRS